MFFCYFSLACALFLCDRSLLDVALLSNITMAHSWYRRWSSTPTSGFRGETYRWDHINIIKYRDIHTFRGMHSEKIFLNFWKPIQKLLADKKKIVFFFFFKRMSFFLYLLDSFPTPAGAIYNFSFYKKEKHGRKAEDWRVEPLSFS